MQSFFEELANSLLTGASQTNKPFTRLIKVSRSGPGTKARLASRLMSGKKKFVLVVARDATELFDLRSLLQLFDPELQADSATPLWKQAVCHVPPYLQDAKKRGFSEGWAERLAALYALKNGASCLVITPDALSVRMPPLNFFDSHTLELSKGTDIPPDLILEQLVEWGYKRVQMVGGAGELAMRGDILDLYCPGYKKPIRLEFFGDMLDDLRLFDPVTQRSSGKLDEVTVLPAQAALLEATQLGAAQERWEDMHKQGRLDDDDLYCLRKELHEGGRNLLPGMFYAESTFLADWLPKNTLLILPGEVELQELLGEAGAAWQSFLESQQTEGLHQPRMQVLQPQAELTAWLATSPGVYFEELKVGVESRGQDLPERTISSFQDLFSRPEDLERPWQRLVGAMKEWSSPSGVSGGPTQVILSFSSERGRAKFLDLAEQDGIVPKQRLQPGKPGLYALLSSFRRGFSLAWDNTLVLGEDVLQPRQERSHRPAIDAFRGMDRYDELQEGDLLVHRDYGVCAFGGLQRLDLAGVANDFLLLRYAADDKLYLPVDRLGLIQLFKAPDGVQPALDKLGGIQWKSSKEKARKAIEKIAEDLVEMYAYRKVAKGFTYGPLSEMFREFEATFGFEETPDQARAIEEVLADMAKPEPMDRLVCGDVGFGKTEVAMRASFRAALEGRQVALLCPTTVLAEQHYQTFRARLAGFPVNVGLLSRFVTKARQKEVLHGLERGQVDIVIGTHRLLSKDVVIPKLGLIVLDEEQRFGVRHKELLKQMRKNVDVLTLTATPIPRTLQLSLSGVRELSVIETPPPERKPVSSALINRDDAALRSILERELAREGQVFWVYNRVQGLERAAEYVTKLVPHARIGMAHGQMNERELEETMRRFWHGELDVLVCTAIIESGLDFPRANTLVVDQAQLFGLGQLYQLRGRVGRSDKQAFAIFVCPDVERLPEITRKRMRIILDMDYLGAGFQVAMEDLRLRGAGNILGESQSGHMSRLGLELFLEMLEEAVAKMRGQPLRELVETELNLGVAAHIPENYVTDSRERLRCYKALSSAPDEASLRDVEFELRDRFGPLPPELENFISVLNFKRDLAEWGVLKAEIYPELVKLSFSQQHAKLDPNILVAWVNANRGRVKMHPPAGLELSLSGATLPDSLARAREELKPLLGEATA